MYYCAMQLINSVSKYLIVAMLCCTLLLMWETNNNDIAIIVNQAPTPVATAKKQDLSVWSSMRSQLMLDHKTQTAEVRAEIRKLLAERDKLNQILRAATPYIYFIYQQ